MRTPRPSVTEALATDSHSVWRFQSSDTRWESGGVDAYAWSQGQWLHQGEFAFGAPLHRESLCAYFDHGRGVPVVAALDEGCRTLALIPQGGAVETYALPFQGEHLGLCAVHVAGQGTLFVFSRSDDEPGSTCVLEGGALRSIASNPWIRALTHDPERGVIATGFETFLLQGNRWTVIGHESISTPVHVPGAGLLALTHSEHSETAAALARFQRDPSDPSEGEWAAMGDVVRTPIHGAWLAYVPSTDSLLVIGGQQGPRMELSARTHVIQGWRELRTTQPPMNAEASLHGSERDVRFVAQTSRGLVGFDAVDCVVCTLGPEGWSQASGALDVEPFAFAANEQLAYVYDYDGGVHEWNGSAWRALPGADGPGPRQDACFFWDAHGQRLVLHGGYRRNDTWVHNGHAWRRLSGGTLPHGHAAARTTRDGVFAIAGRGELYTLRGDDWLPLKVPPLPGVARALLSDAHGRLLATSYEVHALTSEGWTPIGQLDDSYEIAEWDPVANTLVLFFDVDMGRTPEALALPAGERFIPTETLPPTAARPASAAPPSSSVQTAHRVVFEGAPRSADKIAQSLGLAAGSELIAVVTADPEHFPLSSADAVAIVIGDQGPTLARNAECRWEESEPLDGLEEIAPEWFPAEAGYDDYVRFVPVRSNVGWMLDLDATIESSRSELRPYRLEPFADVAPSHTEDYDTGDAPDGHCTKFGGFPHFIHRAVRVRDSEDQPMRLVAQLGEDLFDCSFGDAGRLWMFLSADGSRLAVEVQG